MAKNTVTLTLQIDDKGNLKQVGQKADKAAKGVGKMTKETHSADRAMKGLSQQSSSGTKNFSKMAQGLSGGLVPAYATLAANIFAVTAAFRFLSDAANYRILIEGQREWATVTGESLSLITSRLQEATGQQLAFAEAAQSTAIARAAGVSVDQIERLGTVAKNASIALGRDLTDSVNRLIRGTTKAEPELLDELGIILRLETASKNYAAQIGKTAEELSMFEKTQAVTNEVLRQGEEKFGDFATELNSFTKLAKSFDDLLNKIKGSLTGVAEFMARAMSKNVLALAGGFTILGSSILRSLTPDIPAVDLGAGAKKAAGDVGKFYKGKRAIGAGGKVNVKELERSMKARKSTVLDFENFSRREAEKTLAILKANNAKLESDSKGVFGRIKGNFLANLYTMQAEHGKWVGAMKFAQRGLMRALSWAGWIGMAFTAFGIVKQLYEDWTTDEATKKFNEQQQELVDRLANQNEKLKSLNSSLRQHKGLLQEINQIGKFFGNFAYGGTGAGFGDINKMSSRQALREREGNWFGRTWRGFWEEGEEGEIAEKRGTQKVGAEGADKSFVSSLSGNQISIIENVVGSLRTQLTKLDESIADGPGAKLRAYVDALEAFGKKKVIEEGDYAKIAEIFADLEDGGGPAVRALSMLGNVVQGINDAIMEYTKATGALRKGTTEWSKMTDMYLGVGGGLVTAAAALTNVKKDQLKADKLLIQNAVFFKERLGPEKYAEILKITDRRLQLEAFGLALQDKGNILLAKEVLYLNQARDTEIERINTTRGMPKLLSSQVNKLYKVQKLEEKISRIVDYTKTLKEGEGVTQNAVEIANEEKKLELLRAQLGVAKDEASLVQELQTNILEAFSTSLMTAIDGLIQGTVTVKEAFANMAQAILRAIAQILAKMAALKILSWMFPGTEFANFLAGGGYMQGKGQRKVPGYRSGGVVTDPTYMVGEGRYNEAVVPLPDGRSIPVQMSGGAGNVQVNVNISSDGQTTETLVSDDGQQAALLGKAISAAVQEELHKQQRPGGTLSPYGP